MCNNKEVIIALECVLSCHGITKYLLVFGGGACTVALPIIRAVM